MTIAVSEATHRTIQELVEVTGIPADELVRQAIDDLEAKLRLASRRQALQQARGMWKNRMDLPDLGNLRREWDRI
jgi:hypothetical protein